MNIKIKDANNDALNVNFQYYNFSDNFQEGQHFYCNYDKEETIKSLFDLQIKQSFAHISILFRKEDLDTLLSHISVYDCFSYTLVPYDVDKEVYQKIYDFYFFSPMSVSYITFVGSLVLSPKINSDIIMVNDNSLFLGCCSDNCFLKLRNCSRIIPFLHLFHPYKVPTEQEINKFCNIMKHFSLEVYRDFSNMISEKEQFETFSLARQSLGIKSHYWINVWNVY